MKYIKKFDTTTQYNNATLDLPNVSLTMDNREVHYNPDIFRGHEYVDLGLPSGTLWATCNVDRKNPQEVGDYIAWGETQQKGVYDYTTYAHGTSNNNITKYTAKNSELELIDDAAHVRWGGAWHIPSRAQFLELINYTSPSFIFYQGSDGLKLTSLNDNNKFIFFPAGGMVTGNYQLNDYNQIGHYWSKSVGSWNVRAYNLYFDSNAQPNVTESGRIAGFNIRPVIGEADIN